jgi:hypothetical protein
MPENVFDDVTAFDAREGVFNDNTRGRQQSVQAFIGNTECLAFGLFLGLPSHHPRRFITLKASILAEGRVGRIDNGGFIGLFLVMFFPRLRGR